MEGPGLPGELAPRGVRTPRFSLAFAPTFLPGAPAAEADRFLMCKAASTVAGWRSARSRL